MTILQKMFFLFLISLLASCKSTDLSTSSSKKILKNNYLNGSSISIYEGINDTSFVKLKDFSNDFIFEMKYASNDNFLKNKVYECEQCYLRLKTIKNLIEANAEFLTKGYRIKLFDCYRPLDVQKKMWELVPNTNYVANPKTGSIHNRGGAVDITLVDEFGTALDMGTEFDFFGPEASHYYQNSTKKVKKNRAFLKEIMLKHHFISFDSEWWHYNLSESNRDPLANFKWDCN